MCFPPSRKAPLDLLHLDRSTFAKRPSVLFQVSCLPEAFDERVDRAVAEDRRANAAAELLHAEDGSPHFTAGEAFRLLSF